MTTSHLAEHAPAGPCTHTHPHDDSACVDAHTLPTTMHRTGDGRTWRDSHLCTMCPVRAADGTILPFTRDGVPF